MSFATPVSIPHWAFPVTLDSVNGVGVVEQGSVQDVESQVLVCVSCMQGDCPELPTAGITDPTFQAAPPSADTLVAQVQQQVPNATVTAIVSVLQSQADWQISLNTGVAGTAGL